MTSAVLTTLSTPGTYPLWYKAWRWLQSTELGWPGLSFLTARLSMATEIKVQCWLLGHSSPSELQFIRAGEGEVPDRRCWQENRQGQGRWCTP